MQSSLQSIWFFPGGCVRRTVNFLLPIFAAGARAQQDGIPVLTFTFAPAEVLHV